MQRYFKLVSDNLSNVFSLKFKGLSDEGIKAPTTSNKILNPSQDYFGTKAKIKFAIIIRYVLQNSEKLYPQIYLNDFFYELV